jgi:hypothetical protein
VVADAGEGSLKLNVAEQKAVAGTGGRVLDAQRRVTWQSGGRSGTGEMSPTLNVEW